MSIKELLGIYYAYAGLILTIVKINHRLLGGGGKS